MKFFAPGAFVEHEWTAQHVISEPWLRVLCGHQTFNTERTEHLRDLGVEALHVLSISAIAEVIGPARDQLDGASKRDLLPLGPGYIEGSRERPHADLPVGQPV